MTAEHYHALYRWFDAHPAARRFVVALDRWLPLVPFVCYPVLLCKDSTPEPFDVENYLDTCF